MDTNQAEYVFQMGALAALPYLAELLLERGFIFTFLTFLHQTVAGSLSFFLSRQQSSRVAFEDDIQYGGAQYIATGRGFAIRSSTFLQIYTNYGRTHILPGFELGLMCCLVYILNDCADCNYASLTWGTWLVSASLIFSPFWFNPLTFDVAKVKKDYHHFRQWLGGEVDPSTGTSWQSWNSRQLEKVRNESRTLASHWCAALPAAIIGAAPPLVLAIAAVVRMDLSCQLPSGTYLPRTSTALFAFVSMALWTFVATWHLLSRFFKHSIVALRVFGAYAMFLAVALSASLILVTSLFYNGRKMESLGLIILANVFLFLTLHRILSHMTPRLQISRLIVDQAYFIVDALASFTLLAILRILSAIQFVGWAQNRLLFSDTFASSVDQGKKTKLLSTSGQ